RRRRVRHGRVRASAGRGLGCADRHGPRRGRTQGLRPDRRRTTGRAEKERLSVRHRRRGSPQGTVTVLRLLVWGHVGGALPGTALVEQGLKVFDRIAGELQAVLKKKGYPPATAVVGRLKEL